MVKFGIVVPLYNKAPYVKKALESILNQTYPDWELVVVDDGSKDESYNIAKQCIDASGKTNCKLIQQPNAGVATARNNGVAMLNSEYVCFLDADDWWTPTFLEEMDMFIKDYPDAGLWASDYYYVKNGQNQIRYKTETGYIDYCETYLHSNGMPIWTGAACLHIKIFDEFDGFRPILKLGEDFDLWLRISFEYKVAFLNKQLTYYNQDADAQYRAIKKLHNPVNTELYYYDEYLNTQPDNVALKALINAKRISGLMKYYLSDDYTDWAKREITKVDRAAFLHIQYLEYYKIPRWILKLKRFALFKAYCLKQKLQGH